MPDAFLPGQTLFLASGGVVTLTELAGRDARGKPAPLKEGEAPAFYVVRGKELVACVPVARAGDTLRPLVPREVAEALRRSLIAAAPAPLGGSSKSLLERGRDVVHAGSPAEQVAVLKELCELPAPISEALGSGLRFLAGLVLEELAAVLGLERAVLEAELCARYPAAQELWSRGAVRFHP